MSRARSAWNAVFAVLLVAGVGSVIGFFVIRFMHGMDPCHVVNAQLLPSPQGDYLARKIELSCRPPKPQTTNLHEVQVALSERSANTGKAKQYATVFRCKDVTASEIDMSWDEPHRLGLTYPTDKVKSSDISARQPKFKDVDIAIQDPAQKP